MDQALNLIMSGAVSGAIYSLIASGLVLSYSASGIFNLSYGGVAFSTAFVYYELNSGLHWSVGVAAVVAVLVYAPLLGLLLDVAVFRPLARADDAPKIMATVGLAVALPAATHWIVERMVYVLHWNLPLGDQVYFLPGLGPAPRTNWRVLGGVNVNSDQAVVFGCAAISAVLLWYLLRRTTLGLQMRAHVDRRELAAFRGVDGARVSRTTWMLGAVLAGLAGVAGAPILNSLDSNTYTVLMFVAIAASVLGGLRSIPLAFLGGLALGVSQNLVAGYATFAHAIPGFNSAVPFIILLGGLTLMVRRGRSAASPADAAAPPDYYRDLSFVRRAWPWGVAVAGLVAYILFLADEFWLGLVTRGLALSLIFLSFVVITGIGGMVSLAQATFVTCAGLTTGVLVDAGVGFFPAAVLGIAAAVLLGLLVAVPSLRLGGLPLALATLALAFVGDRVLFAWDVLGNGALGWTIPRPNIGPIELVDDRTFAMGLLVVIGIVALVIRNVSRSASGRGMSAVRSTEVAARSVGISPTASKLKLFALSAAIAGLGGVFLVSFDRHATSSATPAVTGLLWVATVVLLGVRRIGGAVIAGLVSVLFPQILTDGIHFPSPVPSFLSWNGTKSVYLAPLLFGLGAVQLARDPDGLLSIVARRNYARRAKRRQRDSERVLTGIRRAEEAAVALDIERHATLIATTGVVQSASGESQPIGKRGSRTRALLELIDVRACYGDVEVLHGVSVGLAQAQITALIGANGAGKSTLCSVIAGSVRPSSGIVKFDGVDITGLSSFRRARGGVVFAPETRGIFPGLSVDENLALWLRAASDRGIAYDKFPLLYQRRRQMAGSLSGGEQQMLTLAPLFARPPTVLVADEPTLGLAPKVVAQLMDLFQELRDQGVTVLLVEERAGHILEIARTVVIMELGHILWQGPRAEIDLHKIADSYLGGDPLLR